MDKKEISRSVKLRTTEAKDQDRGGARAKDVEDNSAVAGVVEFVEIRPKKPTAGDHCDSN
jgi:hypothetical protein